MSVKSELSKLGSGVGYIYLTDVNDNIKHQRYNTVNGKEDAFRFMLISSTLSSEISASSLVEVTSAGGDITNLAYDGVSVFDTGTPVTGATTDDLAANLAIAINAHLSTPEYTAVSSGSFVTVYLAPALGDTLNGEVAAISTTGTAAMTATDLDGGSFPTGEIDPQVGYKMYLNASVSAVPDSLTGSTDVTSAVLRKAAGSPYSIREVEISSGSISVERDGAVTVVSVQTEGAVASDDLESIDAGVFSDSDTLILRGKEAGKVTTVKEGGNIELANNADFLTGAKEFAIILQYSVSDNTWYEINRSPGNDLTVSSLRAAGIPEPVSGVEVSAINLAGATTTITAGTDKGTWVLTGSGTLTGSVAYNLAAGVIEGDRVVIRMSGGMDLGGFSLSLAGQSLSQEKATHGVVVESVWEGSSWVPTVLPFVNGRDLVDTVDLATKEDDLGLPAVDGYQLVSTTAGVRSWVPNSTDVVIDGNGTTNSSAAGLETTLRSVTVIANTLSGNGSSIEGKVFGEFAANANAKFLRLKFGGTTCIVNTPPSPNGVAFYMNFTMTRASASTLKVGVEIGIEGESSTVSYTQIGGLDLVATNYDIDVTGEGVGASDVTVYGSMIKKFIV